MVKLRLYIEIYTNRDWYSISPQDIAMLGIPCPKRNSSVWNKNSWKDILGHNHSFMAMITGYKNPNGIIRKVDPEYLLGFEPKYWLPFLSEKVKLELRTSISSFSKVYGFTVLDLKLFQDAEYWDAEVLYDAMELKYSDLIEDFETWVNLSEGIEKEFDDFRIVLWLEE